MITSEETSPCGDGRDDVAWLAWRYLLDELDPLAAAAFEDRLAEDEGAAEALADAVALRQAIVASRDRGHDEHQAVVMLPDGAIRRWRLVGIGAVVAACVAAFLVVRPLSRGPHASHRAADLVRLWNESSVDIPLGDEVPVEDSGEAVDDVPAWLLTAVTLDQERRAAEAGDELPNELL